jgi:hypothetical protein
MGDVEGGVAGLDTTRLFDDDDERTSEVDDIVWRDVWLRAHSMWDVSSLP